MGLAQEHFQKLYKKIIFLNQNVGKKEARKKSDIYDDAFIEDGKIVVWSAYKESLVDDFVYFKIPGYIGKLAYGNWYNLKYGSLEITIMPDEEVKEKGSIKELLRLIEDYIRNSYFEYDKKINKFIYGENEKQKHKVKYKTENIFSMDNVKNILIVNALIDDDVVNELKKYKNLESLRTVKCDIKCDEYISVPMISDTSSEIKTLNMFNGLKGAVLILSGTKVNEPLKALTLEYKVLRLKNIEIDYELFILLTNFIKLYELEIDGYKLNELETLLLPSFVHLTDLELEAKTKNLDFLSRMPLLTNVRSNFEITDEVYFEHLKNLYNKLIEKYPEFGEEHIRRLVINHHINKLTEIKKEYEKYILPRMITLKWQGIFENSTNEEIARRIKMFKNMPLSERNKILNSGSLRFIETDLRDSYKILGIDLPNNKNLEDYKSSIIGPYGKYLYMMTSFLGSFTAPIIGSDGKLLETIEFRNEKDVEIPEHEVRHEITYVNSEDSIFEYFYNRQVKNEIKIKYLLDRISETGLFIDDDKYQNIRKYNEELNARKKCLQDKDYNRAFGYLIASPSLEYREVEIDFNGEKATSFEQIPDPYYQKGDFNLYSVIDRYRSFESVKRQVTAQFDENNICEEERLLIIKEIEDYINDLNEIDSIKENLIDEIAYIETILTERYKNIIEEINKLDIYNILIDDIETFLNQFNLSEEEREIFINYILLKQTSYWVIDEIREEELEHEIRFLEDIEGASSILFFIDTVYECESYDEAYEKGKITKEEYQLLEKYMALQAEISSIQRRRKEILSIPRENWYISAIETIDALTDEDLKNIKENVAITSEYEIPFSKFVDYIHYYITGEYPAWIRTELMKYKYIKEECVSKTFKEEVESKKVHVYSYKKVNKNPFSN